MKIVLISGRDLLFSNAIELSTFIDVETDQTGPTDRIVSGNCGSQENTLLKDQAHKNYTELNSD